MRRSVWYRAEKRRLRPFLRRLWGSGGGARKFRAHLAKAVKRRLINQLLRQGGEKQYQPFFEPARYRLRVRQRNMRRIALWTMDRKELVS